MAVSASVFAGQQQQQQLEAQGQPVAAAAPASLRRPPHTVRFARVLEDSPADAALPPAAQHALIPSAADRRASVYGYGGVSGGFGIPHGGSALPPTLQQGGSHRRASMYAAIGDSAEFDCAGTPATWATSADLRLAGRAAAAAPAASAALDPATGSGTFEASTAASGGDRGADAAGGCTAGCGASVSAGLGPVPTAPHGLLASGLQPEEESTMELYSQLIRCRCRFRCCVTGATPCQLPGYASCSPAGSSLHCWSRRPAFLAEAHGSHLHANAVMHWEGGYTILYVTRAAYIELQL